MMTKLKTIDVIDNDMWLIITKNLKFSWNDAKDDLSTLDIIYCGGIYAAKIIKRTDKAPLLALGKCEKDEIAFRKERGVYDCVYDYCVDMEYAADMINILNIATKASVFPTNTFKVNVNLTDGYGSNDGRLFFEVKTIDSKDMVIKNIKRAAALVNAHVLNIYECYEVFKVSFDDNDLVNTIGKDEFETMNSVYTSSGLDTFVAFVKKMYGYEIESVKNCDIAVTIYE